MSGHSYGEICPICNKELSVYSDYKPFSYVSAECMHCGFSFSPKVEQMDLATINYLREDYNENGEPVEKLEMLTQKDLDEYSEKIKDIL